MMGACIAPEGQIKASIPRTGWGAGAQLLIVAGKSSSCFASPSHPAPVEGQLWKDFLFGSSSY